MSPEFCEEHTKHVADIATIREKVDAIHEASGVIRSDVRWIIRGLVIALIIWFTPHAIKGISNIISPPVVAATHQK